MAARAVATRSVSSVVATQDLLACAHGILSCEGLPTYEKEYVSSAHLAQAFLLLFPELLLLGALLLILLGPLLTLLLLGLALCFLLLLLGFALRNPLLLQLLLWGQQAQAPELLIALCKRSKMPLSKSRMEQKAWCIP